MNANFNDPAAGCLRFEQETFCSSVSSHSQNLSPKKLEGAVYISHFNPYRALSKR